MKTEKTDRRVRRTRELLTRSLMQLMEEKDIRDITVCELSDLADINRGTFYLHYRDVYDLLTSIEDGLFSEFDLILNRHLGSELRPESPLSVFEDIFSFLEKHREVARVMIGPHGDSAFVSRLKNLVKQHMDCIDSLKSRSGDPLYTEAFIVSGCTGVIEAWLNHSAPQSPREMAACCSNFLSGAFQDCSL